MNPYHLKGMDAKCLMQNKHEGLNRWLQDRLWNGGRTRYSSIDSHVEYAFNGVKGEWDTLGVRAPGVLHYYEVKSHDSPRAYGKAMTQFSHALTAFPGFYWQFIYVTPERIRHLHPHEVREWQSYHSRD